MNIVVDDPDMIHGNWKPQEGEEKLPRRWGRGYPPYSLRPLGDQQQQLVRSVCAAIREDEDDDEVSRCPVPSQDEPLPPAAAAAQLPSEEARGRVALSTRVRTLPLLLLLLLALAAGRISTVVAPTWAMTYANLPVPAYTPSSSTYSSTSSTSPYAWEDRPKPVVRMHDELVGPGSAEAVPWMVFAMAAMSAALNRISGCC